MFVWKNRISMKAIEFNSKIKNNSILIPSKVQLELKNSDTNIRVIVLIDEENKSDEISFKETVKQQFLKGYADTDSIYDSY